MSFSCDIAIVGAGMAGASLAAALVAHGAGGRIVMLEGEDRPGYHATGRSAAFWHETYGGPGVQPLSQASGPALWALGVLHKRRGLTLARKGQEAELHAFVERFAALGVRISVADRALITHYIPGLNPDYVLGALEEDCCDIDVAALHQHYLAEARQGGVDLLCDARVASAAREGEDWALTLADGRTVQARLIVNAAGAWADGLATMAGAAPLGITPYRRTMIQARVDPAPTDNLPLVLDLDESFYFKPESGRLWLTPHDETPTPPCDAAPEEIDVALGIDRLEHITDWRVERIEHRWAGLRSFAPDRLPVYGFDPAVPGFFWCAGQGGFGIQTAPAGADLAARLLLGLEAGAVAPEAYRPGRFVQG
ncbi:NAD(P)/FAD-dependent oxidoreductase [Novosphingobium rosa]|uniref:NAD(P)/FAD-dependent oxidoreductase n=1 Tax=Novosphingobium rosa TaxID=76978 RepID=UPI00082E7947|nr:FAD-dependent oxidoreductase [Novosphingobium rosa]